MGYDILEGLNNAVKAGKVRYIGISNCFAWQLAKANALAEREGFAKFVSIQGHYNLLFREEEREMAGLCAADNIAMTPYSALAGGRLSKHPGETSKRLEEDSYAKGKYDAAAQQDAVIIDRVAELAEKHGVTMTEISLAWLLTKVTAPVVGATKLHHIEGAAKAVDLVLSDEERMYLEEAYVPHKLVGVMAQNTAVSAADAHVWSAGSAGGRSFAGICQRNCLSGGGLSWYGTDVAVFESCQTRFFLIKVLPFPFPLRPQPLWRNALREERRYRRRFLEII